MYHVTPALENYSAYEGQPKISVAIDEVYTLRALCAHIFNGFTEDLDLSSLPATTRRRMEELLPLLSRATVGESLYSVLNFDRKKALQKAGAPDTLTESEWERNQGFGDYR